MDDNRIVPIAFDVKFITDIKGIIQHDENIPCNFANLKVDWFARCENSDGYFKFKDEAAVREIVSDAFFQITYDRTIKDFMRKVNEGQQYEQPKVIPMCEED